MYKCDECGSTNTYVKDYEHEIIVKGEKIKFIKKRRFCKNCNNLVYDEKLDNEVSKVPIKIYNEKYGIDPKEIINFRKKYKLSQQEFSKIIGCAKKTLVSYENGNSIPNDIYLVTIKTLMDNPEVLRNLIESNKERYEDNELNKLERKLDIYLFNTTRNASEYNGYTDVSQEKIENLILYLATDGILKTKLLKEMFYADFITYENTAASITGLEYYKYAHGPVPINYEDILEYLQKKELIEYQVKYNGDYECHKIISKKKPNMKVFYDDEKEILKKVKLYFDKFTSKEIEDYSHKEKAYVKTDCNGRISYDYAFDIELC